jgi:hypothetical protein
MPKDNHYILCPYFKQKGFKIISKIAVCLVFNSEFDLKL